MGYSFNGSTKIISLTSGTTSFDVQDIYSRWKDWVTAGNASWAPAFLSVGGESIGSGKTVAPYIFLNTSDGWRIRPQESDHELRITGNLYPADPNDSMFVPTLGDFTVTAIIERSSAAIAYAVGATVAPSQQEIRDALTLGSSQPVASGSIDDMILDLPTQQEVRDAMSMASGIGAAPGSIDKILIELHRILGLDPTKPLVVSPTGRTAGAEINQTITENAGVVTVVRT